MLFQGERAGFQIAFKPPRNSDRTDLAKLKFRIEAPNCVSAEISTVELVPVVIAAPEDADEHYLKTEPGLYPDLIVPQTEGEVPAVAGQWRAAWIDLAAADEAHSQDFDLVVTACQETGGATLAELTVPIRVAGVRLPELHIDNAHWFHCDGLADYYGVDVFGQDHWDVIDKQMGAARRASVNTILTPTWTPPLDTAVDGTRTATQLIGISDPGTGAYEFDFSLLEHWLALCRKHGFSKLEIAHFFTQWGAKATPAIYVDTPSGLDQRFGWHVPATSPQYRSFLEQLVPRLLEFLDANWGLVNVLFHISDEPMPSNLAEYSRSRAQVIDLLGDCTVIDAVSDFELFKTGAVPYPVVANNHAEPFLDAQVPLWLYYCVAQDREVSNRFISLPSTRNRVIGAQLFLTGAEGFLHWGFNFYNSFHSTRTIDPFTDTCAGNGFPGGDSFLVYPAPEGEVYESIRFKVFAEAMNDLRAMELLRTTAGSEEVARIVDPDSSITLSHFSYEPDHYRSVINELAMRLVEEN